MQGALTPYVTSSFKAHSLLGVTDILAVILGGVCNLAIAKVIDIWGRAEGFAVMIVFIIVGMVMKAACINVEMFAAANSIYWVGHIGVQYVVQIIYADMTTLRNRMLLFGLLQLPTIAATFGGPKIADLFYTHSNFRWAFGAFCIIIPVFAAPVVVVFFYSKRKAQREGKFPERVKTRSYWDSTKHYAIEFDGERAMVRHFSPVTNFESDSRGHDPHHLRLESSSSAFQFGTIRPSWLEDWLHHCHDCRWCCPAGRVCCLGKILRHCPIFPL